MIRFVKTLNVQAWSCNQWLAALRHWGVSIAFTISFLLHTGSTTIAQPYKAGDLYNGFGTNGIVIDPLKSASTANLVRALEIQTIGTQSYIVGAGRIDTAQGTSTMGVLRLTANGDLDSTAFNSPNGFVTGSSGVLWAASEASSQTVLTIGRAGTPQQLHVGSCTTDGTYATLLTKNLGGSNFPMASTFDASGNLLITGYVVKGSAAQTFVLKVDTAGKILAGPLITDPVGSLTNGEGIAWDDTNQEVVIVGACAGTSANTSAAFVARISSDLTKVVSAAQLQGWTSAELTDCVLANGVLIAGGWSQRGDPPRATVVSINANNKITKQLRFDKNYPSNVTVSSMVVQPDGNIFVSIRDNAEQAFHAARFDSSLSADSSFGSITGQPGWATYNLGTAWPSQVTECSVWLNDSIVLGGWVNATRPSGKSDLQTGGKSPKCAIVRIHATAGAADKR